MSQQGQLCLGRASSLTPPSGGRRPAPEAEDQTPLGLGSKAWEAPEEQGSFPALALSCGWLESLPGNRPGHPHAEFSPRAPHSQDPWGLL